MRWMTILCIVLVAVVMTASAVATAGTTSTYWWGVTKHELSAEDRELVERIVMAEAGGESLECMIGVTQTIRERAEHWGMTVEEVVTAKNQYAKPYKGKISDKAKEAVSAVFDRGVRQFDEYTTHFHDDSVNPWWNRYKEFRGEIDGVLFWGVEVSK